MYIAFGVVYSHSHDMTLLHHCADERASARRTTMTITNFVQTFVSSPRVVVVVVIIILPYCAFPFRFVSFDLIAQPVLQLNLH